MIAFFCTGIASGQTDANSSEESMPIFQSFRSVEATIFPQRNIHIWKRYVRDFRRDHHFALIAGGSQGFWRVSRLGTIHDKSFASRSIVTRAQYSFHLPLYRGFGYLLGSTSGYEYEIVPAKAVFLPASAYQFPTLLFGLVYNFTPGVRTAIGMDYGISRMEDVAERDSISGRVDGLPDDPTISVTLSTVDIGWTGDYFVSLNWALRLEGHLRLTKYAQPKKLNGQALDADFRKNDKWLGAGLVFHLL
jgi:hypothetical protein